MTLKKYLNTIQIVIRDCDPEYSAELAAYFTELHDKIEYARNGMAVVLCDLEPDHEARHFAEEVHTLLGEAAHYASIKTMVRSVVGSDNSFMN